MRARTWIIAVLLTTPLSAQQRSSDSPSAAVAAGAYRVLPPVKLYQGGPDPESIDTKLYTKTIPD
jgi:hypothetical protein